MEHSGFQYIASLLKPVNPKLGRKIEDAWLEYEEGKTAEAKWVREMDKFECMVQALEYEQSTYGEENLEEFQGLSSKIGSPKGKEWLALLQQERRAHLLRRRRRTPVIFVIGISHQSHWPQILTAAPGASGVGKKTQCTLLSQKFGFQHIALNDVLREKSDDQSYLHAEFLKGCLREKANVPTDLAISLLEGKINEGIEEGKKWSLVHGFPQNGRELLQFEEKVSMIHVNRTLLTSTGTKNKLYIASEVLSRGNTPAYGKAGTILK